MRVISSPSSSTTGLATLIFSNTNDFYVEQILISEHKNIKTMRKGRRIKDNFNIPIAFENYIQKSCTTCKKVINK